MGFILFITFLFMHIAFGLALAFFVIFLAEKLEQGWLKILGLAVGWILIILAIISLITGTVFAAKMRNHMRPYINERNEKMMDQGMPVMQNQSEKKYQKKTDNEDENDVKEDIINKTTPTPQGQSEEGYQKNSPQYQKNENGLKDKTSEDKSLKNICYKHQAKKVQKGCPVKSQAEIQKELKQGKKTGAACSADIKETSKSKK